MKRIGYTVAALLYVMLAWGQDVADEMRVIGAQTAEVVAGHRKLFMGSKTSEQALKMPATLWHIGAPFTVGGDLTAHFVVGLDLQFRRDAAKLADLADFADELRPRVATLRQQTEQVAEKVRRLAERVTRLPPDATAQPPTVDPVQFATEPELLTAFASATLANQPALAAGALAELAGRLEHLADLDRWLELNVRWLRETEAWTREPGMAPRSLCYDIAARIHEAAYLQSRVEDVLFLSEAERVRWLALLSSGPAGVGAAPPLADPKTREALSRRVAELRAAETNADRRIAPLQHQRQFAEVERLRRAEYLPIVAELEYLQRELALLEGGQTPTPIPDAARQRLSLTARAALDRLHGRLPEPARPRFATAIRQLLERSYGPAYADLFLYQAAVLAVEPGLAQRIVRWLEIEQRPGAIGLMEIFHSTPGAMGSALRADNAYLPRIFEWASVCRARDRTARFLEARRQTHDFYRAAGYNHDKPVSSLRDAIENNLVDCLAGCHIHGAIAAAAGVTGIVPVRYWKEDLGHSLVGLRETGGVWVYDPLGDEKARPFPGGYPNVLTVETAAVSFGAHVVEEIEIVSTGRLLRRVMPHLRPDSPHQ